MIVTRRSLLQSSALLVATPAWAGTLAWPRSVDVVAPGRRDHAAAVEAIADAAQASLIASGLPGMVLALRGADGFAADLCLGWANLATRAPVAPAHLFEIGSISKSLVALTLWKLAAAGRVDLAAAATRYLPADLLPAAPITVQQLLNHSAGLANFSPVVMPNGERPWTATPPGSKFYYSNTGYTLAGMVIDAVTGRPHAEVIAEEVLRPIGMTTALAHIRTQDRARFATGYVPERADLVPLYGRALAEGPWTEEDLGAGAVAASVADMRAYLDYVLGLGRGRGAPLLPDAAAQAMLAKANTIPAEGIGGYSNGFMRADLDGRAVLRHTGGMLMFTSAFVADPAAGVGAFASVNGSIGEYRPTAVVDYATRVLRAVADGKLIPAAPDARAPRRVADADALAGNWVASDGEAIEIVAGARGPTLRAGGRTGRLESMGGAILADLDSFDATALEFERADGGKGAPDRLWIGDRPFARDAAPSALATDEDLAMLAGTYKSDDPWVGSATVFARGNRLVVRDYGALVRDPRGFWRFESDAAAYERLTFDTPIGGKMQRLMMSGHALVRVA